MMRHVMESGLGYFGMCCYSHREGEFTDIGTAVDVTSVHLLPDGRSLIQTVGSRRFRVLERAKKDEYNIARVEWFDDEPDHPEHQAQLPQLYSTLRRWAYSVVLGASPVVRHQIESGIGTVPDSDEELGWWCGAMILSSVHEQYQFLSLRSPFRRLSWLVGLLRS